MSKFKVGDKVRVTGDKANWYHDLPDGYEAEVVSLTWSDDGLNPGCNLPDENYSDAWWSVAEVDLELVGPAVPVLNTEEWEHVAKALWRALETAESEPREEAMYEMVLDRVSEYLDSPVAD